MSKFDKIFEIRESDSKEKKETPKERINPVKNSRSKKNNSEPNDGSELILEKNNDGEQAKLIQSNRKRGRPPAKRSDPDFVGLTTYIRRETHTKAKIALLQEGKGKELSELVEDLIADWLVKK